MLPDVLKSKRFISAAVGLIVLIVSSLEPRLADHLNTIAPAVVGMVLLLVGGYTVTDSVEAHATAKIEVAKSQAAQKPAA